jgi:hypothetical protein
MERALKPEAQGNVAAEPVADLIARLTYRVNNPSAWDSFDDGASELIREASSSIASLSERLAEVTAQRDRFCDKYLAALKRAEAAEAKLAEARAAAFEEAAQIAENLSNSEHIAFDIREGNFPEQSDVRTAIAAAIRARAFRDTTSEGDMKPKTWGQWEREQQEAGK